MITKQNQDKFHQSNIEEIWKDIKDYKGYRCEYVNE